MANGNIGHIMFNNYNFRNIKLDGSYQTGLINGLASIADPNIKLQEQENTISKENSMMPPSTWSTCNLLCSA